MPSTTPLNELPTRHGLPGLLIVARDQLELWQALKQEFGDRGEIGVLLDRRRGERRQEVQPVAGDRRGIDRRSLPRRDDDLRARRYVLARPHYRRPKG